MLAVKNSTLTRLDPHPEQEAAIEQIVRDKRTLLKAGVGAGKTLCAVEAILRAETKVNLIVAPLNTFTGWSKTFLRQGGTPLRFIDTRKAGKEAHQDLALSVPGNYFMNTERMRTQSWAGWDLDFVVIDEVQRISNRKSISYKMALTMKCEYALELSATPFGGKVEGSWSIGRWLWRQKEVVDTSFHRFATHYLYSAYDISDPHSKYKYAGEREPGRILRDWPSVVQMESVYNELPVIHEVEVALNPTQNKHYRDMEKAAITWLEDNPLVAELPSVKYIRLLELTLATPSIKQDWIRKKDPDTGEWEKVWGDVVYFKPDAKSSKADAVEEIIGDLHTEKPEPVLIFTHSRKFATYLAMRLQSKGIRARQWVGGMSPEEQLWKMENFGREFDVMVATIQSVAEGTDGLQHVCAHEIWCSVSDRIILNEQGRGRLNRQGQERTVNRFVIRAQDTIELKQHDRIKYDQSVLDASYGEVSTA